MRAPRNAASKRRSDNSSLKASGSGLAFDMRPRTITECIFCGGQNLTHEHVFSKWTHKFLERRKPGRALAEIGRQYSDRSETEIVKLPGQIRDWKVRCVCGGTHETCNGGWMRRVEDTAKPILLPLIIGEEIRIFPYEQSIIATWAVLKSIVGEYDGRYITHVHHKQRQYLMEHGLPPTNGWGVWIGSFIRRNWIPEWVSRPFLLLPNHIVAKLPKHEATYFNSCATTQVVNKLFIHVVHTPMPRFIPRLRFPLPHHGTLFRIWPPSETSIQWPGRSLSDQDADVAAHRAFSLIEEAMLRRPCRKQTDFFDFAGAPAIVAFALTTRRILGLGACGVNDIIPKENKDSFVWG